MARPTLNTYLNDHLSGATAAIEIIRHLSEQDDDQELTMFASDLKAKIEDDKKILVRLIDQTGVGRGWIKVLLAWCAGVLSKLKLGPKFAGKLGTFEALETLSIGVWGKRALWRALQRLKESGDTTMNEFKFDQLISQAESQFQDVETWRMNYCQRALGVG